MRIEPKATAKCCKNIQRARGNHSFRTDNRACDEELKVALSDLESTVATIFDYESVRGADDDDGRVRGEEDAYVLCERNYQHIWKLGESDRISELKPQPLFSGRRPVAKSRTGADKYPSQRSSAEDSGGLSFDMASCDTSTTSRSGMARSISPEHSGNDIEEDEISFAFPIPPKSLERMAEATQDGQMLQGMSPTSSKSSENLNDSADGILAKTASKTAKSATPSAPSSDLIHAVTYPSNTLFHSNLGSSRPLPPFYAEASAELLQKAKAKAQDTSAAKPRDRRVVSAQTSSSSLYTKVWAPPPYPPSRSRSQSPSKTPPRSEEREYEEVLRRFQEDRVGLKRSTSTYSIALNETKDQMQNMLLPPAASDKFSKRYDSFGYIDAASQHNPVPSRKHPFMLDTPLQSQYSLETRPHTSGEHKLKEIDESLKALECTDERQTYPSRIELTSLKALKRHGTIRRIASAASGQLRRHFTPLGSRQRDSPSTRPSSSASNITDNAHESDRATTPNPNTESRPSKTFESPPSHSRHGIEVQRIPTKALRVLGPIDTWKEIEAQEERRARDKKRMDITSRLHEAGF